MPNMQNNSHFMRSGLASYLLRYSEISNSIFLKERCKRNILRDLSRWDGFSKLNILIAEAAHIYENSRNFKLTQLSNLTCPPKLETWLHFIHYWI
ncbi:hypothetical protein NC651_033228 [Populus alba x Populus x berolinensis]|nr:hypothetical protein NC651_033228 [Populus alba x Populus x berolinensis]